MHYSKLLLCLGAASLLGGCVSSGDKSQAKSTSDATTEVAPGNKYKTTDGRTINIGKPTSSGGGTSYKNPHMDKCWVAEGFTFAGMDTVYIVPTLSTAKFSEKNKEEVMVHDRAKDGLV